MDNEVTLENASSICQRALAHGTHLVAPQDNAPVVLHRRDTQEVVGKSGGVTTREDQRRRGKKPPLLMARLHVVQRREAKEDSTKHLTHTKTEEEDISKGKETPLTGWIAE